MFHVLCFVSLTIIPAVQLLKALESFIVVEREGQIIACGALFPFFEEKRGEVAAIAVSSECRGQGLGDKLLGMIIDIYVYCFLSSLVDMNLRFRLAIDIVYTYSHIYNIS